MLMKVRAMWARVLAVLAIASALLMVMALA